MLNVKTTDRLVTFRRCLRRSAVVDLLEVFCWRIVRMNRVVVLGAAAFLALVGFAMFGSADKAVAGHGCSGCSGVAACSGDDCSSSCHCGGLFSRLRAKMRSRCCGTPTDCCGTVEVAPTCSGDSCSGNCGGSCSGRRGLFHRHRCSGRAKCHGLFHGLKNRCCGTVTACPPACCG